MPEANPLAVNVIAITDEYSLPIANQFPKGLPGTARVDHEEGGCLVGHDPHPHQNPVLVPGGFIEMIHLLLSDLRGNHLIGRLQCLRYPVKNLLDRSQTDKET